MFEAFRKYINKYAATEISDDDFEVIKNKFTPKHYRKRMFLLQEDEVCKYAVFIVKGAVRQYTVDKKGIEHVVNLGIENWWVGDRESFTMIAPSPYNIEAVEDTDVLLITKSNFEELVSTVSVFTTVLRNMDYNNQVASQKRINATISFTAEERYQNLEKTNPVFLQRFPQHIIASYLGITKETLSRVRNHSAKK